MDAKDFADIKQCWFCLAVDSINNAINDALLYKLPFIEYPNNYVGVIRHDEYSDYKIGENSIKIRLDNTFLSTSECSIFVINNFLPDYKKGHFSEQLSKLISPAYDILDYYKNLIQTFFFVLLNYSKIAPNSVVYSQHLEIINEILDLGHKVFVLNVRTLEGRKELIEELILESIKIQRLRKKIDKDNNKKKSLCVIN